MVNKKVKVFIHGIMAIGMKAASKMIIDMVIEQLNLLMVESMLVKLFIVD